VKLGKAIRSQFAILTNPDNAGLIYFDNAATTQKPQKVIRCISDYYSTSNANIGREVYKLSMDASKQYESARYSVAEFINADSASEVIFTKGTTESVNFVETAFLEPRLEKGDEVLVAGMEHHSNLLPWQRVCHRTGAKLVVVAAHGNGEISSEVFSEKINCNTKFIAICHVSNVLGTTNPVKSMIANARKQDIPVLVDGAQAIAHNRVDVQDLDADFYCFSGHKMYAPTGIGVLYIKEKFQDEIMSFIVGDGVANNMECEKITRYMPKPHCFEAGTPNLCGAVGLEAAITFLQDIGMDAVSEHEISIYNEAISVMSNIDNIIIYGNPERHSSIISFNVDGIHPYDIGNLLNEHNIAVRTGVHCEIPFVDSMGNLGTVRASFSVYNDIDEIHKFADVLKHSKSGEWTRERPGLRCMY
jgi:cysteine desulfurase/selenocysteine lyase